MKEAILFKNNELLKKYGHMKVLFRKITIVDLIKFDYSTGNRIKSDSYYKEEIELCKDILMPVFNR